MQNLIPTTALAIFGDEPRILDVDLAKALGMAQPLNVRTVIASNRDELELHGEVFTGYVKTSAKGGRPGKAYYLNEGQALVICALSRTPVAAQIRKALIDVFMAYRTQKTVVVKAHRRRMPEKRFFDHGDYDAINAGLQRFADQPQALIQVLARCVARLDALDA